MNFQTDIACLRAVDTLLGDHFCVRPEETVVLTVDERTDATLVRALCDGIAAIGARRCLLGLPQLPFQGSLADPYIPEPVALAVRHCDVWLDLTFPYMAGSGPFDAAMEHGRARYLLIGDLTAEAFGRLYGRADFDALFALQSSADRLFTDAQGHRGRITSPLGTELTFTFGRPATVKHRRATQPGAQTIPGSAIFYPELESVHGTIVLEAAFHEHFCRLSKPITLEVDGTVRSVRGGADAPLLERALRRASRGGFGHVIHLTVGLNPGARSTGRYFMEDIRVVGCNAVGLGLPWWLPGGGENHPDAVVCDQSLWIDDEQIIEQGRPVAAHPLAGLLQAAEASIETRRNRSRQPQANA